MSLPTLRYSWRVPKENGAPILCQPNIPHPLHGCLRGDSEVLTSQGWKRIDEVTLADRVACWDIETEQLEWQPPLERIKVYSKQMVRVTYEKYKTFSFLVTPDHRLPIRKKTDGRHQVNGVRIRGEQKWTLVETTAAKINLNQFQHFITAARNGTSAVGNLSYLERVYIAVQADGSFRSENEGVRTYRLSFKKDRKKKRFEELCRLAGIPWTKHSHKENSVAAKVGYQRYDIRLEVECKNFWNCFDITQFGQTKAKEFIEEISVWDGSCQETCGILNPRYVTTSLQNAKFAQAVAVIAGMTSSLQVCEGNEEKGWKTTYVIDFLDRDFRGTQSCKKEVEEYEDYAYCINVPTHFFVARDADTGSVMITGNCAPRTLISRTEWDEMRNECYENCGRRCEICGAECPPGKMDAHELYDINYKRKTSKFVRLVGLCKTCHGGVIHSGRAITMYKKGYPWWDKEVMLRAAEHGFQLVHEWNKSHPDKNPLKMFQTIEEWTEEPSLELELRELIQKYQIEFYRVPPTDTPKDWGQWKLLFNDEQYMSPYKDIGEWREAMEKNNKKEDEQNRDAFNKNELNEQADKLLELGIY